MSAYFSNSIFIFLFSILILKVPEEFLKVISVILLIMKYNAVVYTVSLQKNKVYPGYCTIKMEMKILPTFFRYRKYFRDMEIDFLK